VGCAAQGQGIIDARYQRVSEKVACRKQTMRRQNVVVDGSSDRSDQHAIAEKNVTMRSEWYVPFDLNESKRSDENGECQDRGLWPASRWIWTCPAQIDRELGPYYIPRNRVRLRVQSLRAQCLKRTRRKSLRRGASRNRRSTMSIT